MKNKKKILVISSLIILILIASGFFFYSKNKKTPANENIFSLPEGMVLTEEQQKKFDEANAALKINPEDADALIKIAQLKYYFNDLEGAKTVYLKVSELKPGDILVLNNLADIYDQLKDYDNEEKILLKLTEANSGWINGFRALKNLYAFHMKEKYPQMESILLKGIEANKVVYGEAPVDFYSMLAVVYQDTGNNEKAIEYYEKVLELDPKNEGAKIELEKLKLI